MSGRLWPTLITVGFLVTAVVGCQRAYPQPSAEALLSFLQNARLHGRLRVCWPTGQAYVEKVMRADAALHKALRDCAPIQTVDDLWSRDDPRWQTGLDAGRSADSGGAAGAAVSAALNALAVAITSLPADLPPTSAATGATFVEQVWQALAVDGRPLSEYVAEVQELGQLQTQLRMQVTQCAASFDMNTGGLAFTDENCQRAVDSLYDKLAALLDAREERLLEYAAAQMAGVHARINRVNKQRQRDEYLLLDNTREYFDNLLRDGWLKRLDDRIRAANHRLTAHRTGKAKLAANEAAFLEREVERLKQRYESLSQRVEAALRAPGAQSE